MKTKKENSAAKLAAKLNISDGLLSMLKSGDRDITYRLAVKLNRMSKIDIHFWMSRNYPEIKKELLKMQITNLNETTQLDSSKSSKGCLYGS